MFDREYFEKNEFVKKIYSFENLQCIEDQNDVMHICFNIDINFFRPTGVTITSILENNSNMKFAFHIFTDAVNKKDLEALEKTTVKYKQSCYVYLMDMAPFANFHIKHPRFKKVSYFIYLCINFNSFLIVNFFSDSQFCTFIHIDHCGNSIFIIS